MKRLRFWSGSGRRRVTAFSRSPRRARARRWSRSARPVLTAPLPEGFDDVAAAAIAAWLPSSPFGTEPRTPGVAEFTPRRQAAALVRSACAGGGCSSPATGRYAAAR